MQFRHTIVLAVIAMFMAVSCITVDKTLGEGFISSNQNLPVQTAEIDLPVQVKASSPLQGLSTGECLFGSIRTEDFGLVQFSTAADICPNMTGWDFGKDPVIKEVYFLAPVGSTFCIDDKQAGVPQQITMHRTYKRVDTTTLYNNSFTAADYNPEPMNATECLYFGGDSIKVVLKNSFAEEILSSTTAERDSLDLFAEKFKGILLKTSSPEEGVYGGRENTMSFGAGAIYIRVDYQPTWEEGLSRKDTIFTLSWGYNYCLNLSEYQSGNYETENAGSKLQIEGCAGVKPFISRFEMKDAIENWKQEMGYTGGQILVAKGELIFPFEIPEDLDMTKYPTNLYPCNAVLDTTYNSRFFNTLGDVNVSGYNVGTINRSLCQYAMDIPSYIQDFVSKDKSELDETYDLWLMPLFISSDSYSGEASYSIDCTTYYNGMINGPEAERRPKLRLVYSVMPQ